MLPATREKFEGFTAKIAALNSASSTAIRFAIAPNIQQTVVLKLREQSDFLSRISIETPVNQEGEKLGVSATRPIASRTKTGNGVKRVPTDPTGLSRLNRYRCEKQNSDYAFPYAKLDAWAHMPDFQQILRNAILQQQALDKIICGWHGTHVADNTDPETYPLLQDLNKGWIQHLREDAPERVFSAGVKDPQVKNGAGVVTHAGSIIVKADGTGDYVNLDAMVVDALQALDERVRTSTDLVVILGAGLAGKRSFSIYTGAGDDPRKKLAADIMIGADTIGGKPTYQVPHFPANAIMITSFKNLAIYIQLGASRRLLRDEPDYDQIANYESENVDYVIEDYGKIVFLENIVVGDPVGEIAPIEEVDQEPGLA